MSTDTPKSKFSIFQKKKEDKKDKEEELPPDPNEPVLKFPALSLIYLISYEWIWFLLTAFFAAASGAMPILFYLFMGDLLDGLAKSPDIVKAVSDQALKMTYVAIASGVAAAGQNFFSSIAYERIGNRLRAFYFEALLQQEIGYFDRNKSGKLLSQLSQDVIVVQEAVVTKISTVGQFLVSGLMGIILAFTSSWQMTLVMLACSPIMGAAIIASGIFQKVFTDQTSKANAEAMNTATEVIGGIRTVRSMAGELKEQKRFDKNLNTLRVLGFFKAFVTGGTGGFTVFSIWGSVALAFWYGGTLVKDDIITIGDMMKVFGMMLIGSISLSQVLTLLPEVGKAVAAGTTVLKVVRRKPQIRYAGGLTPESFVGNLEFKNIDFAYPTRPHIPVLKNFNLTVKPGQQIALVGQSGSGKSTIVGLLERWYEPTAGTIILDGHDIREYDQKWLHSQIAIVTQEPVLFAMTLRENILYGVKPGSVSITDIENAAIKANAHQFIVELAKGYNTKIGERGVSLSGGQKQRIAIARAVLQNPKLLLLDEATSALDSASEKVVQDALNKLMEGRTTIVIAHRLSTIQHCDHIVVIEKGVTVESGTHHELLKSEGTYHKLATRQIVHEEKMGGKGDLHEVPLEDEKKELFIEQPIVHVEHPVEEAIVPVTQPVVVETTPQTVVVEATVGEHKDQPVTVPVSIPPPSSEEGQDKQ